ATASILVLCLLLQAHPPSWPSSARAQVPAPRASIEAQSDADRIADQPVCVGSRVWSAGELAPTIAYRLRRVGDRLFVGYFACWSTERPWGNNVLTYTVLPALVVDGVYSHFLFGFSGVRDAMYGPEDVEGVTVEYRDRPGSTLQVVGGVAEDGIHGTVHLS